jgi:CRP/FNR family transcriptional regulator
MIPAHLLAASPFFSALQPDTQAELNACLVLRRYPGGEIVQLEGDPCQWLGFVHSGVARVFKTSTAGREQVLTLLHPGSNFNLVPIMGTDETNRASVRAESDLQILLLDKNALTKMIQNHADFALALLKDTAQRLDRLALMVSELSLKSVRSRLARFLIDQADGQAVQAGWTQDEIAAHLGTVRDVVGRILRAFMDEGLIARRDGQLLLMDKNALEDIAKNG